METGNIIAITGIVITILIAVVSYYQKSKKAIQEGNINIKAGDGGEKGNGGDLIIKAGDGNEGGKGGDINIKAGNG